MKRNDFRELASLRLKEAGILLENECWDGAYYLSGYVVEYALKACIARQTERHDFPDKARVNASHTHDLTALLALAGLEPGLRQAMQGDPILDRNWAVVRNWKESSRYLRLTQPKAEELFRAVADRRHGILRWLRQSW